MIAEKQLLRKIDDNTFVDDKALSEPWMSKDLLLEDNSPALLTSINISSAIPNFSSKLGDDADKKNKDPLKRITQVLWLIAFLLLIQLFK